MILVAIAAALIGGAVVWAVLEIFVPPTSRLQSGSSIYATAREGSVGASISLNTEVQWQQTGSVSNEASGIVTTIHVSPGAQVKAGEALYTVDLRPVIAAAGAVPAFRDLSEGDSGQDVAQLQKLLSGLGYFHEAVTGQYSWTTRLAVDAWHRHLGEPADGTVHLGDVMFFPALPIRITYPAAKFAVGSAVAPGENDIGVLAETPSFDMPVSQDQASIIPIGTDVVIHGPNSARWTAVVSKADAGSADSVKLKLSAKGSGAICGTQCNALSVTNSALLPTDVITVPTVKGIEIPTAAISSTSSQRTIVRTSTGKSIAVHVVESFAGQSIVTGLAAGTKVVVSTPSGND